MTSQKLSQAISLIKAGNKKAAMPILKEILQSEPNNEKAWIAMYTGVDNPKHKKMCLQKILAINPNNQGARKALADMEGRSQPVALAQVQPSQANNSQNRPPARTVRQAPARQQRVAPKQKKKASNSKGLIIGAVALFLLFCIGGSVIGGSWYFKQKAQTEMMQNSDEPDSFFDNFGNSDSQEEQEPSPDYVPENTDTSESPTQEISTDTDSAFVTDAPMPDVRFVPYAFTKGEVDDGWVTVSIDFLMENHSPEFVYVLSPPSPHYTEGVSLHVAQGYDYDCYMSFNSPFSPYRNTKNDYPIDIMSLPSLFQSQGNIECEIPEMSDGYKLSVKYEVSNDTRYSNAEEKSWENSIEVSNFEQANADFTFPFIEGVNFSNYKAENVLVLPFGQSIDIGDVTISFFEHIPLLQDNNYYSLGDVVAKATNNFSGGDSLIAVEGSFYIPRDSNPKDGIDYYRDWGFGGIIRIGPGQTIEDSPNEFSRNEIENTPTGSCLYIYRLVV